MSLHEMDPNIPQDREIDPMAVAFDRMTDALDRNTEVIRTFSELFWDLPVKKRARE